MTSEIIIFKTQDGKTDISVKVEDGTVWLTQGQMVELFNTTKQNISLHIKNIFDEGEQDKDSVVKEYLTTAADGKNYNTKYYNLDVIISVGYRVKSTIGTQFRIWATQVLKEYMVKGFAMNDRMLKEVGGGGYSIGRNYLPAFGIFVAQKKYFIVKSLIFMQPHLIMIKMQRKVLSFSRWCKIKCTTLHTVIQQQK